MTVKYRNKFVYSTFLCSIQEPHWGCDTTLVCFQHSPSFSSSISATSTKPRHPQVIVLSSLHFSNSLFQTPPHLTQKAGMGGIINTNLWNSLWRREGSIWVWIWLILDTLWECYHHKAKTIYLICLIGLDGSHKTHKCKRTQRAEYNKFPGDQIQTGSNI